MMAPFPLLGFINHADAGTYADAIRLAQQNGGVPDVTATRRNGTMKYGLGISADQELTKDIGVFMRLGWNDGKTESFAFTAMDRVATGGVSFKGARWHRPDDNVAGEITFERHLRSACAVSRDGRSRFRSVTERLSTRRKPWPRCITARSYSKLSSPPSICNTTPTPPTMRHSGPVWIPSIRLHTEFGKK